jgi:hypothetical protein
MKFIRTFLGITFLVILASCISVPSAFAGDTFNIDVNLSKSDSMFKSDDDDKWYQFPDDYQLDFSNSSLVCPSNQCKTTLDVHSFLVGDSAMSMVANLQLVDDGTNGHLTPKKQKLIEKMQFSFSCKYQDIQEDLMKKTTKYICSEPDDATISRNYNDTTYPYKFTATFELPSRHLVINANEAHENPYFMYSGDLVFKDEDGKLQVK